MALSLYSVIRLAHEAITRDGLGWIDRRLNDLEREGRLTPLDHLASFIMVPSWEGPPKEYPTKTIESLIGWTSQDEVRLNTDKAMVDFVQARLETAYRAHDEKLLEEIGPHKAAYCPKFRYRLTDEIYHPEVPGSFCRIWSAYSVLGDPLDSNGKRIL